MQPPQHKLPELPHSKQSFPLSQENQYYIDIKTYNSNIIFDKYYLDGKYYYLNDKKISFKTNWNNIIFKLSVDIKSEKDPDKLHINFYKEKFEEDETQNSSNAVIFASVLAYISFALSIFPIIIVLFYICGLCDDNNTGFNQCDLCTVYEGGIDCGKFKAVYLFKRE